MFEVRGDMFKNIKTKIKIFVRILYAYVVNMNRKYSPCQNHKTMESTMHMTRQKEGAKEWDKAREKKISKTSLVYIIIDVHFDALQCLRFVMDCLYLCFQYYSAFSMYIRIAYEQWTVNLMVWINAEINTHTQNILPISNTQTVVVTCNAYVRMLQKIERKPASKLI